MDDKQFREHLQRMLEKDLRDQGLTTMEIIKRDQKEKQKQKTPPSKKTKQ